MYLIYVKNSKFIYGNSIAKNNLMKMGLLEVYSLQLDEAYKHAFIFIRQLAIAVRKAFLHTDKEETLSVYNWQFICSLKLWCEFVARNSGSNDHIKSLTHPLTQVILVDKRLRNLEDNSNCEKGKYSAPLLVPSLPLLLDVFQLFDFNKRASAASNAPMDLRLMLHFSPSQRKETACMDAVAVWLHDLLTEALCLYASSVAFPEYSAAALSEMRAFLRSCRVANFTRNFKTLLTKAREHVDFVKRRRATIKSLLDSREITALESSLGQPESPFLAYYLMHRRIRVRELAILSERFKFEGEEHMKAEDDFTQDKESHTKAKGIKAQVRRSRAFDGEDSDQSDTASDASYEIDDGTNVTHISRSGQKKNSRTANGKIGKGLDSGEDDFDLYAALNGDDGDDDKEIANDSDDDTTGNAKRRQRILREDPDLGAMNAEESEVDAVDEAETMDIDLDSFSSGDEEEEEEEKGGREDKAAPSKVRRWKVADKKKPKSFASISKGDKVAKKWNRSKRRKSYKVKKSRSEEHPRNSLFGFVSVGSVVTLKES
ncbi:hypothetical protein TcWFU_001539 [Taenia crassiceps]|uniref:Uncharacterized protein n=1 Tax=Taenia crassiceps TaxID=6207 RepID=A0ABR4Q6B5_9CEST